MSENKLFNLSFEFAVVIVNLVDSVTALKAFLQYSKIIDYLLPSHKGKYEIKLTQPLFISGWVFGVDFLFLIFMAYILYPGTNNIGNVQKSQVV